MELVPCVHSLDPGLLPDGLLQPARQRGPGWRGLEDLLWAGQVMMMMMIMMMMMKIIMIYSGRDSLFTGDGSHASTSGTYLTALTMLETIWPGVRTMMMMMMMILWSPGVRGRQLLRPCLRRHRAPGHRPPGGH